MVPAAPEPASPERDPAPQPQRRKGGRTKYAQPENLPPGTPLTWSVLTAEQKAARNESRRKWLRTRQAKLRAEREQNRPTHFICERCEQQFPTESPRQTLCERCYDVTHDKRVITPLQLLVESYAGHRIRPDVWRETQLVFLTAAVDQGVVNPTDIAAIAQQVTQEFRHTPEGAELHVETPEEAWSEFADAVESAQ